MTKESGVSSRFELSLPSSTLVQSWWKWILETPASKNSAYGYSDTEVPTNRNQPCDSQDIWFLAGAFNDGTLPHTRHLSYRSILAIPHTKALLLPIINFFAVTRDKKHIAELEQRVKYEMDVINAESLYVTIDGQEVPGLIQYRADTAVVFPITVDGKDNVVKLRHVLGKPIKLWAKGDGYWLFLKPLPPGKHEIRSFGSCLQGKIQIEVHYKFEVVSNNINNVV
jgi:hypothetical protein